MPWRVVKRASGVSVVDWGPLYLCVSLCPSSDSSLCGGKCCRAAGLVPVRWSSPLPWKCWRSSCRTQDGWVSHWHWKHVSSVTQMQSYVGKNCFAKMCMETVCELPDTTTKGYRWQGVCVRVCVCVWMCVCLDVSSSVSAAGWWWPHPRDG